MALKDEKLMEIQHIYNGKDVFARLLTDKASPLQHMHVLLLVCATLEGQNWHITITELEANVLHGVAGHGNCAFEGIFLCINICKFSSCMYN